MSFHISKAYDSISWLALIKIMRRFGFIERWNDMVFRLISNCWYTIIVNEIFFGFFTSNRGLRQGEPSSPFLYIIASEVISRGLNKLHGSFPSL